jgi:hypothetical protein
MSGDLSGKVEDVHILALVAGHLVLQDGDQVLHVALRHAPAASYTHTAGDRWKQRGHVVIIE